MKRLILAAALAAALPVCAFAQATPQEIAACKWDAIKVCGVTKETDVTSFIGRTIIGLCMIKNKSELSPACQKVLAEHGF